ncbi:MAG: DHH family phosphoesterase, partial [Oscillospiraceae bacterium]
NDPCPTGGYQIEYGNKYFSVYPVKSPYTGNQDTTLFYFIDDNKLKSIAKEYFRSRPGVISILVDNYAELLENARESERTQLVGELEYLIENFARENHAFYRKLEKDSFILIMEQRYLQQVLDNRFPLLDAVRKINPDNRMPATLSVGVGCEATSLKEAEMMSEQALDMALGRGGDQAAIKTKNGYDFYGGVSKGVEKRTKVRTRIIATAMEELILGSSNVLLMGHRFADLDSLGSAIGLQAAISKMGKKAHVVIDSGRNLAKPLYNRFIANGKGDIFVSPVDAVNMVTESTLLIILDTHSPHFVESPEVYNLVQTVIVVDHHRKMVDYISRAVIFYHEPHASSACEMVTELVQYLGSNKRLSNIEAEALLSGIMLDTKNFVLRAGVRTFEAAAYLRRLGADTVEVRKLFSSSMESYQERSLIVSSAKIYNGCAIAISESKSANIKIITAQAADELMGICDVRASFVLFREDENTIAVSARSMGEMNVQVIIERLGGGGHLTMAGTQLKNTTMEQVHKQLLDAIDHYRNSSDTK